MMTSVMMMSLFQTPACLPSANHSTVTQWHHPLCCKDRESALAINQKENQGATS